MRYKFQKVTNFEEKSEVMCVTDFKWCIKTDFYKLSKTYPYVFGKIVWNDLNSKMSLNKFDHRLKLCSDFIINIGLSFFVLLSRIFIKNHSILIWNEKVTVFLSLKCESISGYMKSLKSYSNSINKYSFYYVKLFK